jgi:DNA-binding GntR family transcriptional regulator
VLKESVVDQFVGALRSKILAGDFGLEGYLPELKTLADQYKLSRSSVVQGINILKAEGLVTGERSFRVAHMTRVMTEINLPSFAETLQKHGLFPSTKNVVDPEIVVLPETLASLWHVPLGTKVIHQMRLMEASDMVYQLAQDWYVIEEAQQFLHEMQQDPNMKVLARIGETIGIAERKVHERITARLPTSEEISLLEVLNITPVLESLIVQSLPDGRVLLIQKLVSPGSAVTRTYDCTLPN